jgi:K+-transporting ATPase KdpF subunit
VNEGGEHDGFDLRRGDRRILRLVGVADRFLRQVDGQGEPAMNWVYWLSGLAALGIFVYLVIALFKPEYFE